MDRRTFLVRVGAPSLVAALAGCGGTQQGVTPSTPKSTVPPTGTATSSPRATAAGGTPGETTGETTAGETATAGTETATIPRRERPVVFVSPAEVQAIRAKVDAEEEPWRTSFAQLVDDADSALDADPKSVTDNGAPANVDDPRKYGTDAPYQHKDGVFSDDINRHDYKIALAMKDWIRDTAEAYAFTRKDKYAKKSIDLIHHWFLDPETGMYPSNRNYGPHTEGLKSQNSIEFYIFIPAMIYGATLVSGHPYWKQKGQSEDALHTWMRKYQKSLEKGANGGPEGDEIYKWWTTTRALTAAYLGDQPALEDAFDTWRTTALKDFEADRGTFRYSRHRTRGLYYSLSAMNALTMGAEIARHHGVDLYGYTLDGMSEPVLKKAHDYHVQYALDPTTWPWKELGGLDRDEREYGLVSYEMCYSRWQNPKYLKALKKLGRPIYDQRVTGWVTLTHGNRFDLNVKS